MNNELETRSVSVYKLLKMYETNGQVPSLETRLADSDMEEKQYRRILKDLESNEIISMIRKPGKPTEFKVLV